MMFLKCICINNIKIETVHDLPETQLVPDIQIFLRFGNCYQQFTWGFSQVNVSRTSILRIICKFRANKSISADSINKVDRGKVIEKDRSKQSKTRFFLFGAEFAFAKLGQNFSTVPVLYCFDLKCHIQFKTDVSGNTINRVFSQLTLNNQGQ